MGAFVLGVLMGWLAEWLFFTFWVKEGNNGGDCSSLEAELEAKNRQIQSLQSQLEAQTGNTSTAKKTATKSVAETAKSTAPKAKSTASSAPKKTTPKSTTKKSSGSTAKPKSAKAGGDDFTKLSGIGPSMAATLKSLGIDTFIKLAETDDDILRDMLEESGARMNNNKEAMDSWNEQAQLAAKGDFATLKKMQEELKS